jgi:adenylate cyclase
MLGTIREYATERLQEDPLGSAIERAHAEHFAAMALAFRDRVYGAEREDALELVEEELGNLMTAWQYWIEASDLERLDMLLDALWVLHDARGWYHGALELSNGLLEVLGRIPASPERAREEITVRTSLARGLMAIRGYTQEVEDTYRRALALAEEAGGLPDQIPVLRSLAALHLYRAEFDRGLEIGRQLLAIAETTGDAGLQAEGHFRIGTSLVSLGDADSGLEHLEKASTFFDLHQHGAGRFRLGASPGVTPHTTSAFVLWLTGKVDQARAHAALALAIADRLGQPYTLAYARFHVGVLNAWERQWENVRTLATEAHEIARAHDYQVWRATSLVLNGLAATALGDDKGLEMSDSGVMLYREMTTPPVFWPLILAFRARTLAHAGRPVNGLEVADQAIALVRGDAANVLAPQFPILRGDLLVALGDTTQAESSYMIAIDLAQRSGARMNELQAAIALVHLSSDMNRPSALERLRAVYETFSEGFDAPDVVVARALLRA